MAAIGGMSMVQISMASLVGFLAHRSAGHLSRQVALPMGVAIALGAAAGGLASKHVPDSSLRGLFAVVAIAAAALMFLPAAADDEGAAVPSAFRPGLAATIAGAVGLVSGLLGAGGAFLLTPLMRTVLRLPLRVVIANSLVIVLTSSLVGMVAKAATDQIPWGPALFLVAASLVGAPAGAAVSRRLPVRTLRWILAVAIAATAARMAWQVWG
jgi:uncharacterized membrane protein YfcA